MSSSSGLLILITSLWSWWSIWTLLLVTGSPTEPAGNVNEATTGSIKYRTGEAQGILSAPLPLTGKSTAKLRCFYYIDTSYASRQIDKLTSQLGRFFVCICLRLCVYVFGWKRERK